MSQCLPATFIIVVATAAFPAIPAAIPPITILTTTTATAAAIITPVATSTATTEVATTTSATAATKVARTSGSTASSAAEVTLTATKAAWTLFFGPCFHNLCRATADLLSIEAIDCCGGLIVVRHLDEAETTGATCFAIQDDACAGHITKGFESRTQLIIG